MSLLPSLSSFTWRLNKLQKLPVLRQPGFWVVSLHNSVDEYPRGDSAHLTESLTFALCHFQLVLRL